MAQTINLGKSGAAEFVVGSGSKSKAGISITGFNKDLKNAAKNGEKIDFSTLDQVSSNEIKRLDSKALKDYIQKHKDDKSHIQEVFSSKSPLRGIYNKVEGFAPKEPWLKGIVGHLLEFLSNPSVENLKKISKGLVSEDGTEINIKDNALFGALDRSQKLAPLSTALRAIGVTESASEMKETMDKNPENIAENIDKKAIDAYIKESLSSISHVIDSDGNILQSNGDVLMPPLVISDDDIKDLGSEDPDSLTVKAGTLKWDDFVAETFKFTTGKNPGKAIDYANTVMSIFNKKMRTELEDESDSEAREGIKAKTAEVIDILTNKISREFGGEGLGNALESAFKKGAFASESCVKAIVGDASDKAGDKALETVAGDLAKTAEDKGNGLAEQDGLLASLVGKDGAYNILDLAGRIGDDPSPSTLPDTKLNYDSNTLTLATVSEAYKQSAETIARENASKMSDKLLGTKIGDVKARDEYIAGGEDGDAGIKSATKEISDLAQESTKTDAQVITRIQEELTTIKNGKFLVDSSQAEKFSKDLSKHLLSIAKVDTKNKDLRTAINKFTNEISDQVESGNINFNGIMAKLKDIETDDDEKEKISTRVRNHFKKSENTNAFINKFINSQEMESFSSVVKAQTIQDLVKNNTAISDLIMRQAENKALAVSSIDDILDPDAGLLSDASPELALIFASEDQFKNDSTRAEMAMLGLMSLLKSNPSLLSNQSTSRTIAKALFRKQTQGDDYQATVLSKKLSDYVSGEKLKLEGYKKPDGTIDSEIDVKEAARLAGSSISRSQYLEFCAPKVAYARESVVADRLSRMINAHTSSKARAEIYEAIQNVAEHLETVANNLDGVHFEQIRKEVTNGLEGTALTLVNNMFYPGDEFDTLGSSRDRLVGDAAPQTLMDSAIRLKMIIPRLYVPESNDNSSSTRSSNNSGSNSGDTTTVAKDTDSPSATAGARATTMAG